MNRNIVKQLNENKVFLKTGNINNNIKKIIASRPQLQQLILENTQHVQGDFYDTLNERIYCITHNITTTQKCKTCNTDVAFVGKRYQTFCSVTCSNSNLERKEQVTQTNTIKYGGPAPMCSDEIKIKSINTCLEKYGVKYHQLSEQGKKERKQTNLSKYGYELIFDSPHVRQKINESMTNKYGDNSFTRAQIAADSLEKLTDVEWLTQMHVVNQVPLYKIAEILGVSTFCVGTYFKKHKIKIKRFNTSTQQKQIHEYIQTLIPTVNVELNNRTIIAPYELDIVIPSCELAIEVNGIYWHSELNGKKKNYHTLKKQLCNKTKLQLIQITDHEWINKKEIVKSRLRAFVNQSRRVFARKCSIKKLSSSEAKTFFNKTHIQGHAAQTVTFGLQYDTELVAAMSFGKARYNSKYQWELLRFSTTLGCVVIGGASKLLNQFTTEFSPTNIISYADLRWNTGKLYQKLGFKFHHTSSPNYSYFFTNNPHRLYHRSNFQKHTLFKKLTNYDPKLTEWENMQQHGYDRIWDCGNSVWVLNLG